jgi:hypothetical protein
MMLLKAGESDAVGVHPALVPPVSTFGYRRTTSPSRGRARTRTREGSREARRSGTVREDRSRGCQKGRSKFGSLHVVGGEDAADVRAGRCDPGPCDEHGPIGCTRPGCYV